MKSVTLTLNGKPCEVAADPDTPLLYVLRRMNGSRSVRFGCGEGQCGACTVLVDGRPVQSCDIPVSAVSGSIETVEGLSRDGTPHPVVAAMQEVQAGQCGYCLPGIVMTAVALLRQDPHPDRARIAAALDANLCRCGAHLGILRAVELAATRMAGGDA